MFLGKWDKIYYVGKQTSANRKNGKYLKTSKYTKQIQTVHFENETKPNIPTSEYNEGKGREKMVSKLELVLGVQCLNSATQTSFKLSNNHGKIQLINKNLTTEE